MEFFHAKRYESKYRVIVGVVLIIVISIAGNWGAYKSGKVGNLLNNLKMPRSGEKEILPEKVLSIIEFARMNQIKSISMSSAIADNRFIAQPLIEGSYPIIVKDSADILVLYSSELMSAGCVTLKNEKGIRIASCR